MKRILFLLIGTMTAATVLAQTDTTTSENKVDTIRVGGLIIIKRKGPKTEDDKGVDININTRYRNKKGNIETNWGILDIGFAGFNDKTVYNSTGTQVFAPGGNADWFDTRTGKTTNVNIWFFMQKLAVDKKRIFNLKYGLGLEMNNYRFTENIKFEKNPTKVVMDNISYSKNKLAADYITVPMMVNFDFTPNKRRGFGFSAGVSAGYLYSARQKLKSKENGKQKIRDDFDLEPFKISYIGEINLGEVRLYGSYATRNMWKKGLDWTPYTVGIRFSNW